MMMIPCIVCLATVLLASVGVFIYRQFIFISNDNLIHVDVYSQDVIFEVDDYFLSVAIDVSLMRCLFHKLSDGWDILIEDWDKLKNMSRLLSPAYLRFGGNDADRAIFDFDSNTPVLGNVTCDEDHYPTGNITITGEDWLKLNRFARDSGLSLIVDLNVLLRKKSEWDNRNAEALLRFSEEHHLPMDFQLGNEPNSFPHRFGVTVTGSQLAEDYYALKKMLNSSKSYQGSKLIGPEVTRPKSVETPSQKYLNQFLGKGVVVDAVSWHQYYLNGRTATLEDFINPKTLDLLPPEINAVNEIVRRHSKTVPVWLSETSSAYGSGAPGLSNRFVASFLWLDKLGVAARSNVSVVIRQSLFQGNYALIDDFFLPTPDFWLSILYKNLVGKQVLRVKVSEEEESLRFYGHCLTSNSSLNGTLVIYGMNLGNETKVFVPSGITIEYPAYAYVFRPEFNNLKSKSVLLNDRRLIFGETTVEDMLQLGQNVVLPFVIHSQSIGFWVVKESSESACRR